MPMWESRPARRETWTLCSGASSSLRWMPICLATVRSWRVDVLPLADAQEVQVLLLAHPAEGGRAALLLLLADVPPEVQVGEEVAGLVLEAGVLLVGLGLLLGGALARVLDGERGGDHHDLADTAVLVGLQDHAGQARVDGQLGELAARAAVSRLRTGPSRAGSSAPSSWRSWTPSRMLRWSGGSMKGNFSMSPRPAAVIWRMTEARFVRRISASVNSGRARKSSSEYSRMQMPSDVRPQRPLRWLALAWRDRLDGQPLDLGAVAVAGDAGGARVDDVLDARDGEGGLGDVGRQNDPAARVLLEDAVLLGVREAGVEGQDLGEAVVLLVQRVRRVADLALTGEEDEDVALALALELLDGVADRGDLVAVGVVGVLFEERAVAHLHRIRPAADLDDRGVAEVPGEALRVDGRRGDDDLQVGALGQQLGEVARAGSRC